MLAADSVITDLSTWDAAAWIAAVAALIALGALVTAVFARLDSRRSSRAGEDSAEAAKRSATASERSAMTGEAAVRAAQRSADAAEEATAIMSAEADQRELDRLDAAGPLFPPPPEVAVRPDLTADVVLTFEGGPGPVTLDVDAPDVPWCAGIVHPDVADPVTSVRFLSLEPGDQVPFTVRLTTRPWPGHSRVMLPVVLTATNDDDESQRWRRRVPVPLAPPPEPASPR